MGKQRTITVIFPADESETDGVDITWDSYGDYQDDFSYFCVAIKAMAKHLMQTAAAQGTRTELATFLTLKFLFDETTEELIEDLGASDKSVIDSKIMISDLNELKRQLSEMRGET